MQLAKFHLKKPAGRSRGLVDNLKYVVCACVRERACVRVFVYVCALACACACVACACARAREREIQLSQDGVHCPTYVIWGSELSGSTDDTKYPK